MDALNQGMQDELEKIRHQDATKRRGSRARPRSPSSSRR